MFSRSVAYNVAGLCLLAASVSLLVACPGSLQNPQDFTGAPADIIGPKCAVASCHNSHDKAGSLDLTPDANLSKRLVNVPPTGPGCMGLLVDPMAPDQSLLYTKCLPTAPCGTQMPQTGNPLTQDELDELLTWIQTLK
jgi:hypothetical protein